MSINTELWDKLGKTDPKHTKTFKRAGGFSGTAIKPMFSYRRMTEEFGPCGVGWGINAPSFQVVDGPEGEVLVFCTVSVWHGEQGHVVFGVGGDKAVGKNKYGLAADDEAFKKAFTDAITNALKLIGVGADVHMGMFDDNKYVNTMQKEFSEPEPVKPHDAKPTSAAAMKRGLEDIDNDLIDCKTLGDVDRCAKVWGAIIKRDGWTKDYRDIAAPKFQMRRDQINAAEEEADTPFQDAAQ